MGTGRKEVNMLFFSERKELARKFREWAKENNALDCAENVIAFLSTKGLINEEKINSLQESEGKNEIKK